MTRHSQLTHFSLAAISAFFALVSSIWLSRAEIRASMSVYSCLTSTVIQLLLRRTRSYSISNIANTMIKLTILLASMASASDSPVAPLLVILSELRSWQTWDLEAASAWIRALKGCCSGALETEARKGLAPLTLTAEQDARVCGKSFERFFNRVEDP